MMFLIFLIFFVFNVLRSYGEHFGQKNMFFYFIYAQYNTVIHPFDQ